MTLVAFSPVTPLCKARRLLDCLDLHTLAGGKMRRKARLATVVMVGGMGEHGPMQALEAREQRRLGLRRRLPLVPNPPKSSGGACLTSSN